MLNAKEVLKFSKTSNTDIINCYKMILEAARCHETQCIIKPESLSQANDIHGFFIDNGFAVSTVYGTDLSDHTDSAVAITFNLYLLISWKNPKIEKPANTTTVEEAVSKVVEESANDSKEEVKED